MPASILEAGQLFASRMRMSRSIRQLWDVREKYIKYERGWNDTIKDDEGCKDADSDSESEDEDDDEDAAPRSPKKRQISPNQSEHETDNEVVQKRLNAVNDYYVCLLTERS